jgi:hypothetical protein
MYLSCQCPSGPGPANWESAESLSHESLAGQPLSGLRVGSPGSSVTITAMMTAAGHPQAGTRRCQRRPGRASDPVTPARRARPGAQPGSPSLAVTVRVRDWQAFRDSAGERSRARSPGRWQASSSEPAVAAARPGPVARAADSELRFPRHPVTVIITVAHWQARHRKATSESRVTVTGTSEHGHWPRHAMMAILLSLTRRGHGTMIR